MEPSLTALVQRDTLRWIFVGGKGGVGKTTCSCALAIQLAKARRNVLIVSTDPAHNLSDAFSQKFTSTPTQVQGFTNIYAMEIDAAFENSQWLDDSADERSFAEMGKSFFYEICNSIPGIDEVVSFAEVLKLIRDMNFDVVVFDTAPTGHTLRLLSLPQAMEKAMSRLMKFRAVISSMIKQFGMLAGISDTGNETALQKLEGIFPVVQEVNKQFTDPLKTTFVCVCIAEFLSLYETERLIQDLAKQRMDAQNVIVNQLLFPSSTNKCKMCLARFGIQKKYLDQIQDLYEDFHVVLLPLLDHEIRGVEAIKNFSEHLCIPYTAD